MPAITNIEKKGKTGIQQKCCGNLINLPNALKPIHNAFNHSLHILHMINYTFCEHDPDLKQTNWICKVVLDLIASDFKWVHMMHVL